MLRVVVALLLMMQLQGSCQAENREIIVAGTDFAYLYEKNAKGEVTGFAVDILKALAARHNYQLRFELYPWTRAQWMVENGFAQILVGPYKTSAREQKYYFSRFPFYRDQLVFYVRKSSGMAWQGRYAALQNQRVAVIQGWAYGDEFERQRISLKPVSVANLAIALKMLVNKRFDYLAANIRNTEGVLREMPGLEDLIALEPIIQQQDGYFAYCKESQCEKIWQEFEQTYQDLLQQGDLQRWSRAYPIKFPG